MNTGTDSRRANTRRDHDKDDRTKSPEQLEREVDEARASLSRTARDLSDRFSPGELMDQALGMAREHGGEFGRNLGNQVKNNPLPLILTSVGISWMMMSSGRKQGGSVKNALGDAATKTHDKAAAMGDRLHDATASTNEYGQHARDSLAQFYREQPLLAGSIGIAIGAALGALVPSTDIEDEMFGEASDQSVDAAKSKAADKYDEVRDSVGS
ncbi:DUF3618 domain-containing protein [Saccharospirillum sp.]|uniref:DUF3618 domain-containing protein n=1 Tax=Saccharospirillum sp. TaxID=2033801 RepID=UPI0034A09ED0